MFQPLILGTLCLIVIGLLISTISLNKRYNRQIEDQEAMELQLAEQNMLISQQASELESVKSMTNKTETVDETETTQSEDTNKQETTEEDVKEPAEDEVETGDTELGEEETEDTYGTHDNRVYFTAYKVEAGDSLSAICRKNNLDYTSNYRIILSMNGIEDANQIYVGQIIILPLSK